MKLLRSSTVSLLGLCFASASLAGSTATTPPDLVAHWTFDADAQSSVGGWTGTLQGDAAIAMPDGPIGAGCYHNPSGYGFLQTDLAAPNVDAPFSISLWFKVGPEAGDSDLFCGWGNFSFRRYDIGLDTDKLSLETGRDSAGVPVPASPRDGSWHHLVITDTTGPWGTLNHVSFFLDGKFAGGPTGGNSPSWFGTLPVSIGTGFQRQLEADGPTSRDLNGWLDDFGMFSTPLTSREVALIHALGRLGGLDLSQLQPARHLANAPVGAIATLSGAAWMRADQLPGASGDYGGSVDAGTAWITIDDQGGGIRMLQPPTNPDPNPLRLDSFPATLTVKSGDQLSRAVTVRNVGNGSTGWTLQVVDPDAQSNSLEATVSGLIAGSPSIIGAPFPRVAFAGGSSGTQIDAGPDAATSPYNGGNILTTNLGGPLPYSDGVVRSSSALGSNGRYFTLKLPGLFLFGGDLDGPNRFDAAGSGASPAFAQSYAFTQQHGGRAWHGHAVIRENFFYGGPTVNELFLVDGTQSHLELPFPFATRDLSTPFHFSGARRIYYAAFAVPEDTPVDRAWFAQLAQLILDAGSGVPLGTSAAPATGTLAGGATDTSHVQVDAVGLAPGTYPLALDVQPSGGNAEPVQSPFTLRVEEPAVDLAIGRIDRAGVTDGPLDYVRIAVASNTGSPVAWTARLVDAGPWVQLLNVSGTAPGEIPLRFNPRGADGTGIFRAILEVEAGTARYHVPIRYTVDDLRVTSMVPDPLRGVVYALNDGEHSGSILVISPSRTRITKAIKVGRYPSDLAFSPDGSAICVASSFDQELSRIDPRTREVTRTVPIPGAGGRLGRRFAEDRVAFGRDGLIYHSNGSEDPLLQVIDLDSGNLVSSLRQEDLPDGAVRNNVFGDLFLDHAANELHFTLRRAITPTQPVMGVLDVSTSPPTMIREYPVPDGLGSSFSGTSRFLADLNGERLFYSNLVVDRSDLAVSNYVHYVQTLSAYGDLTANADYVHDARTGHRLADLNPINDLAVFAPNQAGLVLYSDILREFTYWPLPPAIRPPQVGLRPEPPDGGALESGNRTLRWSGLPMVEGYRIYLGTDPAAVAAAQPGSPEDLGFVTGTTLTLDPPPSSGTFHWRVDALRGDTVITGSVAAFSVAPFRVTPSEIVLSVPSGAQSQRAVLDPVDAMGNPVAWSATATPGWITLPSAAGSAGDPLLVEIDPAGRTTGTHSGSVRVSGAGITLEVPVTLTVFEADIEQLVADPARPVAYGLHRGAYAQSPTYIVEIDPTDGALLGAIPLADYASEIVLHPHEDRLYALSPYEEVLQVVDLGSRTRQPAVPLPEAARYWSLAHGVAGRIFVEMESTGSFRWEIHQLDTTSGADLGVVPRGAVDRSAANLTGTPSGDVLYAASFDEIQRINVAADPPVLEESGLSFRAATLVAGPSLLVNHDTTRVVSGKTVLTAELEHRAMTQRDIQAITGDGRIVATGDTLYWADSGLAAASLPFSAGTYGDDSVLLAFSAGDTHLLAWHRAEQKTYSFALGALVDLPGPVPVPGRQLTVPPDSLSWSPVDGASGYRVYFGTDEPSVANAGPDSDLVIGTVTDAVLPLDVVWRPGQRYFWRVDALVPGNTITGTVQFFDLPFLPEENTIATAAYALAADGDGLAVGNPARTTTGGGVYWYAPDPSTGHYARIQTLGPYGTSHRSEWGESLAFASGRLIGGDSYYDEPERYSGAVFVHDRTWDGQWKLRTTLQPSPDDGLEYFGRSLASDANQLLVGAGQGFYADNPGRVFSYFELPGWQPGAELVASPREQADYFGDAMALDGTRALIGAPGPGRSYDRHGCAYVFEYDSPQKTWTQVAHLVPSPGDNEDLAGGAVALQGDLAVVGSRGRNQNGSGKVYVFTRRASGAWVQTALLEDPDGSRFSNFGASLALHGDLLFASDLSTNWRGQEGGVVWVYRRRGDDWQALAPIVPPPGGYGFGTTMVIHDGRLIVSHPVQMASKIAARIRSYRIDPSPNHPPAFVSPPPTQLVHGQAMDIPVVATDPDGDTALTFLPADLPSGLAIEDLGGGMARISGVPTDPVGTEHWIRIAVADSAGAETVQTALAVTLSTEDLPALGTLPASVNLESGEDLRLRPGFSGTGPFTWQWQRDGHDIPGATGPTLLLANAGEELSGVYTVILGNVVGSVTSESVEVTIRTADRFAGDWPTFGSNTEHDGHQPATLGRHVFQEAWQTPAISRAVNRPAVAGDTVFVTPNPNRSSYQSHVHAYDIRTGNLRWSHPLGRAALVNPPSWQGGRVYVQSKRNGYAGQLWCLDAVDGTVVWEGSVSQFDFFEAPAVDDHGVFTPGQSGNSYMYGYDLDGERLFSIRQPTSSGWTPTISDGRLFSWVRGEFVEHDRTDGGSLLTMDLGWDDSDLRPTPVSIVRAGRAYLSNNTGVTCVDVAQPRVIWTRPTVYNGSPAIADGRLHLLDGTDVQVVSADDGSLQATYQTGAGETEPLVGQALLLNDHLVVANAARTYVFHRVSGQLVQEIPFGGHLAYADAYLFIAGSDGVLRAWFANAAPEFADTMPSAIDSGAAAAAKSVALAPYAGDPDPDDALVWQIVSVANPSIFRTLTVHPQSGDLTVEYNPWESGSSEVVVSVTDPAGNVTESTITFTVPSHPSPRLDVADTLVFNRQTGLYEHTVTVTNSGAREIAGCDLTISGLPDGVVVQNASGQSVAGSVIRHRRPLGAGDSTTLVLEYFAAVRGTVIEPVLTVGLVTEPDSDPLTDAGGIAVDRCMPRPDGSILIEFTTVPGTLYEIHYSADGLLWKLSPTRVRAAGNRTQWIDRGPPRTDTPPSGEPCRFYRIRALSAPGG